MFVNILKDLRTKKRISQGQLANAIEVSPGNVSDWETGKSKPGYTALCQLARFFEVSADYLLELDVNTGVSKISNLLCDGKPLTESEVDLIAMYRILDSRDKEDVFDFLNLKYQKATGEKRSVYSTYSDTKKPPKNDPVDDVEIADEIG